MNFILWLVMGGIAGWLASILMKRDGSMGIVANVVVGIIGAFIGGLVVNLFSGRGLTTFETGTGISWTNFFVALLGAIILLAIVNLVKRGNVR